LTETRTIWKIPNRRGFQSKWDFWAILRILGKNGEKWGFGAWEAKNGVLGSWGASFYINLSRRPPRNSPAGKSRIWGPGPPGSGKSRRGSTGSSGAPRDLSGTAGTAGPRREGLM